MVIKVIFFGELSGLFGNNLPHISSVTVFPWVGRREKGKEGKREGREGGRESLLRAWLSLQNRTGAPKLSICLNQVQSYLGNKFSTFGVQISPAIEKTHFPVTIPKKKKTCFEKLKPLWPPYDLASQWAQVEADGLTEQGTTVHSFLSLRGGSLHTDTPTQQEAFCPLSPSWDSRSLTSV